MATLERQPPPPPKKPALDDTWTRLEKVKQEVAEYDDNEWRRARQEMTEKLTQARRQQQGPSPSGKVD